MGRVNPAVLSFIVLIFLTTIASGAVSKKAEPEVMSKADRITIPFVENKGQLDDSKILFYSNTFAGRVSVNKDASIGYELGQADPNKEKQHHSIRETLGGALKPLPSGGQKATAKVSHFRGKDPAKWIKDLSTFSNVDMGEVYKGIRLNLQAHGNNVEKIFYVKPGADPKSIQLTVEGVDGLQLTPKGELEVKVGTRSMRFTRPVAYQHIEGKKKPVDVAYAVSKKSYGFQVAAYDQTKELIIDPLITAIFQGSTDTYTLPNCIATDTQGNIYVAGISANQFAVFKFDNKLETMLGSALFGSENIHRYESIRLYDIAVVRDESVYLVGNTEDEEFPVTEGAFDTIIGGGEYGHIESDGFVIKYNTDLNTLLSSTYIGGDKDDVAYGIAIAQDDTVYVAGATSSPLYGNMNQTPFPTSPDAYDKIPGEHRKTKAFVMHLDSELKTMLASTLLGYNGDLNANNENMDDCAYDVAIDANGDIVLAGLTESEHFPVTDNCVDAGFQGASEAFIAKFTPDLQHLLASTFLGGASEEQANVLAIAANNEILVAGWTLSSDFPVFQGSYDTGYNLYEDGFVSRLSNDLTAISASTFLGGGGVEQVSDMVIGGDGRVFVCGGTDSSNFPVTENADDCTFNGSWPDSNITSKFYNGDGFLTIFDQTLTTLSKSTYLGGSDGDHSSSILVNNDDIIVAGETRSDNFPYMIEVTGRSDTFICRFNANEEPVPPPSAGYGHWLSSNDGSADSIYLDINICEDGSFTGEWMIYICLIQCQISDSSTPNPVAGTIDFENYSGTITLGENCKDIPFEISKQTSDTLEINIFADDQEDTCEIDFVVFSSLNYKGECEAGTCPDPDPDPVDPGGGGGGGGGCFLKSIGE